MDDPSEPLFALVPISASDWRPLRDLRLEMLADTPQAYLERLADARARAETEWQERAARATSATSCAYAAVAARSGRWIGTARAAFFDNDPRVSVFSVYVAPDHRGSGVADALLDAVEGWARSRGHADIYLEVHEDNRRATAFYCRRGYEFTGVRRPYELEPSQWDLEMRAPLRADLPGQD